MKEKPFCETGLKGNYADVEIRNTEPNDGNHFGF